MIRDGLSLPIQLTKLFVSDTAKQIEDGRILAVAVTYYQISRLNFTITTFRNHIMIDYNYRIIRKGERYIIQSQSIFEDLNIWSSRFVRWSENHPSVCCIDGSFSNFKEAEHYLIDDIAKNTYEVILLKVAQA
jgi:hypothetical protein